jgi:phosphoribosylamine--glycine ligase
MLSEKRDMKVLVIGSGGREHALVWKIAQSRRVEQVLCAPGNAGIAGIAKCVDIAADNIAGLKTFVKKEGVELTVVGPEAPLAAGIVDEFMDAGLRIFGPTKAAARLEGSKVFCKNLLNKHGIPTATFRSFTEAAPALKYVREVPPPLVVKADGLAAGKGVIVCPTADEASAAIDQIMVAGAFGKAGASVVIEEFLEGTEASILAFVDGKTIAVLESAQDHKRAFDDDKGPNTGGMGAYSPTPFITQSIMRRIEKEILVPTVHALNRENSQYRGILYAGLMLTQAGPKVLEYNVRFGDPETQPVLMRMKSDIVPVMESVIDGRLETARIEWDSRIALCVVMASGGYPGKYEKGFEVFGLSDAAKMGDVAVFHAGTAVRDGKTVTSGGRVLGVTALGQTLLDARKRAYEAVRAVNFKNCHFRTDIGSKAIRRAEPKGSVG